MEKYRGINRYTDKYVYGGLFKLTFATMIRTAEGSLYPIRQGSLQKMAGYDKAGNEVYVNLDKKRRAD